MFLKMGEESKGVKKIDAIFSLSWNLQVQNSCFWTTLVYIQPPETGQQSDPYYAPQKVTEEKIWYVE